MSYLLNNAQRDWIRINQNLDIRTDYQIESRPHKRDTKIWRKALIVLKSREASK